MEINKKLHSVALASAALVLFLILVSSIASAATEQSASQAGPYAYITNGCSDTVSVIDAATNTVTATVPVGDCPVAFGQFIGTPSVQPALPIATFSASPTSGKVPLTVAFTDKSTGTPTKWKWTFGDGKTST